MMRANFYPPHVKLFTASKGLNRPVAKKMTHAEALCLVHDHQLLFEFETPILSDNQILKEYRRWQMEQRIKAGTDWQNTDRLFTQWNGLPIYPDTVTDWFAKFIKRSGLPYVTLHSLRHTNATLMIAEGIDVCAVSRRLGHSSTATTLNIYAHALKSKDKAAAEVIDSTLNYRGKTG